MYLYPFSFSHQNNESFKIPHVITFILFSCFATKTKFKILKLPRAAYYAPNCKIIIGLNNKNSIGSFKFQMKGAENTFLRNAFKFLFINKYMHTNTTVCLSTSLP